jgi:hypothetical protein
MQIENEYDQCWSKIISYSESASKTEQTGMNFRNFRKLFFSENSPLVPLRVRSKNELHHNAVLTMRKFHACKMIIELELTND